ncbi:MAG: ion transporter [Rhodospirillales bacterium]|jgi:voltage-gated sodium channel|tara:strand:- start:268 stop:1062 length:795 start_codon:yes stop_codon:yes gene_type:complete
MSMRDRIGIFIESDKVQISITGLILINAIVLGLETSPSVVLSYGNLLSLLDTVILAVFIIEIAIKMVYRGLGFFKNGWNVFDFLVVSIALIPASGPFAVVRALRILRVLRLLSMVPQMRTVVQAFIVAIPGMLSIVALILLIFYVSAVLATNLFGQDFPVWFGHIGRSMYSLFQIMTLESWSMGIVRPIMKLYPYAWVFFVPFILLTSFAVINLFIGVIVDSMQSQHRQVSNELITESSLIEEKLDTVEQEIGELRRLLQKNSD